MYQDEDEHPSRHYYSNNGSYSASQSQQRQLHNGRRQPSSNHQGSNGADYDYDWTTTYRYYPRNGLPVPTFPLASLYGSVMESEEINDQMDNQEGDEVETQMVGEEGEIEDGELEESETQRTDEEGENQRPEEEEVEEKGELMDDEGMEGEREELDDKGGGEEEEEEGVVDEMTQELGEEEEEGIGEVTGGEHVDDETMEEGEEEEEENGERPCADLEEEEDEEVPIIGDGQGGIQQQRTATAVMAQSGVQTRKRTLSHSSTEDGPKRKQVKSGGGQQGSDGQKHDKYCWVCHKEGVQVNCKLCPRSYHSKCIMDYPNAKISQGDSTCPCPECVVVMNAETIELRSDAMKQLTVEQLMGLLKNICLRMRQTPGSEPFVQPVDPSEAVDYFDYIVYPMDLETLEKNIKKRLYGSTEGFLADAQWLVHNSIVFNSATSQYTLAAKRLLKVCKQELTEIETCPQCYTNAHEKPESWFVEACPRPHILVWAKLKGFPFWPAKAMRIKDNDVDVRFFGQHDRAWVSKKDCFLYSEEMPAPPPKKNGPLLLAIEELTAHAEKLKEVHGPVRFAAVKTPIGPSLSVEQIRRMLPEFTPQEQGSGIAGGAKPAAAKPANNNNNNSVKLVQPQKKSPMTIRISSLKTNPTIVNVGEGNSADGRVTRLTRKSSAANLSNQEGDSDQEEEQEKEEEEEVVSNKVGGEEQEEVEDEEEEEQEENVPEVKAEQEETEEKEDVPAFPKGSEILASALGGGTGGALRRSTRGMSKSEAEAAPSPQSATPQLEKRLTRGNVKTPVEDGDDSGVSDDRPPDAVLEAMGLSKKTQGTPPSSGQSILRTKIMKEEPQDDVDMEDGGGTPSRSTKSSHNTLMEQLSLPAGVKGYRFNLSKDISISAVEGAGVDSDDQQPVVRNVPPQRRLMPGQQRSVPQGIPMNQVRPRLPVGTAINGQQQQQRSFTGQQLRQMVRNARPQHILNPRTGQTIRIAGATGSRPVTMLPVRAQQFHGKTTKESVDSSLSNPVQGPITLPGGTITVTPLTSLIAGVPIATSFEGVNGAQVAGQQVAVALKAGNSTASNITGIINVQQQNSGGTTIVNSKNVKPGNSTSLASAQQRKNLMVSIPNSVNMHLQNLTKTMSDLVKSTVEQITLEIVEFCQNSQGKAETSRLQVEVDKLQKQLKQEVTDIKHNNDIAMKELRVTMENDKKRALQEVKRQMEADKQKAIEETKKKQWCASCGREALFYCCWNTSYCGYPCQEEHWPTHMASCSQQSNSGR